MTGDDVERCPGCGAELPPARGVQPGAHASSGCWALYGDVLAREYGEWGTPSVHRLTVDTYAVQHASGPAPKAMQALGVHLIALHLTLNEGVEPSRLAREIGRGMVNPSDFERIEPPEPGGQLTIADVAGARDVRDHTQRVQRWARSAWEAWSEHHDVIRRWAGR